jgi:hypothetical protein
MSGLKIEIAGQAKGWYSGDSRKRTTASSDGNRTSPTASGTGSLPSTQRTFSPSKP